MPLRRDETALDETFKAAADPTRREILHLIAEHELGATDLARRFALTRPAVSQHLRVLREAGLVSVREEGTRRFYSADRESLRAAFTHLDEHRSLGLLRLQRAVERGRKRRS